MFVIESASRFVAEAQKLRAASLAVPAPRNSSVAGAAATLERIGCPTVVHKGVVASRVCRAFTCRPDCAGLIVGKGIVVGLLYRTPGGARKKSGALCLRPPAQLGHQTYFLGRP